MTGKELESRINSIIRNGGTTFKISGVLCEGSSFDNVSLKVNTSEFSDENDVFEQYRAALLSYYKSTSITDVVRDTIFSDGKLKVTKDSLESFKKALRDLKTAKKNGMPRKQFLSSSPTNGELEFSGDVGEGSMYFTARPNDNGESTLDSKGATTITRMSYIDQTGAETVLFESPVHSMREELKPKMRSNNIETISEYALNYMENAQIINNSDSKCRDLAARLGIRMVLAAEASPLLENMALKSITVDAIGTNGVKTINGFYTGPDTYEYANGTVFTNNFIPLESVKSVKIDGVEIPDYSPTKTAVDTYNSLFQNNELMTPKQIIEASKNIALTKLNYSDPRK